jgi:ribose 5-phosphate isomerase A
VLAYALKRVPGVVEHGLFLGVADMAIVGTSGGVQLLQRAS